jgi:hypothetical protein
VLIYTLIEHKAKPEPRIGLQLLGYQYHLLEQWDQTEGRYPDGSLRPLPAVVTLVVYQGAAEWTVPLSLAEAVDLHLSAALRPYLLDFHYSLVDLGRIPDIHLSQERRLRVGLLILKHGPLARATRKKLLRIAREAMRLGYDDLVTLIYYLLGDLEGPESKLIREVLRELLPEEEERVMSLAAEQWKAEGRAEGRAEGEAKGRAEGEAKALLRLLERRFHSIPDGIRRQIQTADLVTLETWFDRAVDAPSLKQVFTESPVEGSPGG